MNQSGQRTSGRRVAFTCLAVLALVASLAAEEPKTVSFHGDVRPILRVHCWGCHNTAQKKGGLSLTTYADFLAGGETDKSFVPGDPEWSYVMEKIAGEEATMPKDEPALAPEQIELIARWISEGADDDTPEEAAIDLTPPLYSAPPVISALAYSPDGKLLAVSGYREVLVHKADGSGLVARLVGRSPRIESIVFSPNGKQLAVSGGSPALWGEIQLWDVASRQQLDSYRFSNDTLFGVSFSPDGGRLAFGCADTTARIISAADGVELLQFGSHSDWVFATTFTVDGKRLLTGSRDRAMKLLDAETGQFIDDINNLIEGVMCFDRHPTRDEIAYGGLDGTARIYKISDNQGRTAAYIDNNLVRAFERQPGTIRAVGYSPDGESLALGGSGGPAKIYSIEDGELLRTFEGSTGAVFALSFHPKEDRIAIGGFDGAVRIYDVKSGELVTSFEPVPILTVEKLQAIFGS